MNLAPVCFSHGKESGPWGTKIQALATVARAAGRAVESIDYQGMDDPGERVARLVAWCRALGRPAILVGSSMGGHVAAVAATEVMCGGLFLLAPAFYVPGYEQLTPQPADCPISIVHGWGDEVIPWQSSLRFATACRASLTLLDDDHRLVGSLATVCQLFAGFLETQFVGETV